MEQKRVVYLETGSTDPYYNLAFEEYVLLNRKEGDILILWQNDNAVIIGQNQNAEAEINKKAIAEKNIKVVRRTTGGGAVYHDMGNLNYSFITDAGESEKLDFNKFARPVIGVLRKLGLDARLSGRNDIVIDDRKISGTAQRITGGRLLHHGTLLFDSDPCTISDALNADPEKFRDKAAKSVRSRIGNIRDFLNEDMTIKEFNDYLKSELLGSGYTMGMLSEKELTAVRTIRDEKYATWEWNYGKIREYDMTNRMHFSGGSLEVRVKVKQGIVEYIDFFGDFMSAASVEPVCEALAGLEFRRGSFEKILADFDISLYFGAITKDELLACIFRDS